MSGPLDGIKVIAMAGIGPGPFCAMMLADQGAEVLRIDAPAPPKAKAAVPLLNTRFDVLGRGQRSAVIDLKAAAGRDAALKLIEQADVLIEGYRPSVMERLGLGPDICLENNPGLIYGRMTGWGQSGPLSDAPGHDINYIALSGALSCIGRLGERPLPPLNLVGDFGGGGLMLAFGVLAALQERTRSGKGQVVDAAMTEGAALLMASHFGQYAFGMMPGPRGSNLMDGGPHFYDTYECADGRYLAVGSVEPEFYARLVELLELEGMPLEQQYEPHHWAASRDRLAEIFRRRPRDEWCDLLEGSEACVSPVLDLDEAPEHPQNRAREAFVEVGGISQPAPAPRFDRTPADTPNTPPEPGADTMEALRDWGLEADEIEQLLARGVVVSNHSSADE